MNISLTREEATETEQMLASDIADMEADNPTLIVLKRVLRKLRRALGPETWDRQYDEQHKRGEGEDNV